MFGNSLLTQIGVAGLAIGIVVTYIRPTIDVVKGLQDDIENTRAEAAKIISVNERLSALYAEVNAIRVADKTALMTYLPDKIDEVKVLKDLAWMARDSNVFIKNLSYDGVLRIKSSAAQSGDQPTMHSFKISLSSSYAQLKNFLLRLEQNNYPFTVHTLSVVPAEGGILDVTITLLTYSHKE